VIGVQPETISRYERGAIPLSLSQLFQIAEALGIGADVLLASMLKKELKARENWNCLNRWSVLDSRGKILVILLLRKLAP